MVIGSLAVISLIAFFTSEKYLRKRDTYFIGYEDVSVSGLEVGSPVKYLGVKVGTITDIRIDPEDVSRIIVKVELKEGTPIKKDARADIVSMGITGLKMIEIHGASKEADLLSEGEFIKAGSSEEITGKAEVVAEKMERVFNNLQRFTRPANLEKIMQMIERTSAALDQVESMLRENRHGIQKSIRAAQDITAQLDTTSQLLQSSADRVHRIVYSDTVAQILASTRDVSIKLKEANLEQLIQQLSQVADRTNQLLIQVNEGMERGSVDFLSSMRELRTTLENLNSVSRLIQEDPSVLVRGTKVKGAPDQYLER
ncbi:MCE family protein [candidate division KSB1 bacterium]|nr:MCE family protein [candidate division KSB1 bacterium]NIU23316.1 MCE family protein [candidate division KSB1 bacterium]NIU90539.1 MCE family protein [candidate division KSB1 bacterium]NIV92731.1 MCE family protein [candidate division KSB1 bacterium]NIW17181.1 MCE family protein [candidate division KSB1 bacterium]